MPILLRVKFSFWLRSGWGAVGLKLAHLPHGSETMASDTSGVIGVNTGQMSEQAVHAVSLLTCPRIRCACCVGRRFEKNPHCLERQDHHSRAWWGLWMREDMENLSQFCSGEHEPLSSLLLAQWLTTCQMHVGGDPHSLFRSQRRKSLQSREEGNVENREGSTHDLDGFSVLLGEGKVEFKGQREKRWQGLFSGTVCFQRQGFPALG